MRLLCALIFTLLASTASAEQKQVFGEYEVHYIAFTSSELDKDVAKIYGIPRSGSLGYMSISVLKTGISALPVAWNAKLTGTMSNLLGQTRELEFTRIQEQGALYFHSTFDFYDRDMYRFHIKVQPDGQVRTYDLKFSQKFYRGE
ncbi:MAG: DUF4426 domain-containing protein [Bermanella sp.]